MHHITPTAALPSILTEGLLPRIGERSRELGEHSPAVYLFFDRASAEDGLCTWMSELFEEDQQLALLEIDPSPDLEITPTFTTCPSWEWTTSHRIPPERITVVTQDL